MWKPELSRLKLCRWMTLSRAFHQYLDDKNILKSQMAIFKHRKETKSFQNFPPTSFHTFDFSVISLLCLIFGPWHGNTNTSFGTIRSQGGFYRTGLQTSKPHLLAAGAFTVDVCWLGCTIQIWACRAQLIPISEQTGGATGTQRLPIISLIDV